MGSAVTQPTWKRMEEAVLRLFTKQGLSEQRLGRMMSANVKLRSFSRTC